MTNSMTVQNDSMTSVNEIMETNTTQGTSLNFDLGSPLFYAVVGSGLVVIAGCILILLCTLSLFHLWKCCKHSVANTSR